jgi:signal transduction histidine kinase
MEDGQRLIDAMGRAIVATAVPVATAATIATTVAGAVEPQNPFGGILRIAFAASGRVARLALLGCLASALIFPRCDHAAERSDKAPIRVLLLHPDDLHARQVIAADAATRAALLAALPQTIEFYSEGFETLRLTGAHLQEAAFVEQLLKKYGSDPPNLIITHGEMFGVVMRHRAELWPEIPLMFVDVAEQRVRAGELPAGIPRISVDVDFAGTFALARRLQPEARRVLVVFGTTDHDQYWGQYVMHMLEPYRNLMKTEATDKSPMDATLRKVAAMDRNTIVIYVSVVRDQTGRSFVTQEVAERLAETSKAPMYSAFGSTMGLGLVGGSITRATDAKAFAVGETARRLLKGEPAADIPNAPAVQPGCAVDWRAVQHWQIDASRIPASCRIFFREPSFISRHPVEVIGPIVLAALLGSLSVGWLRQRRRGERAEAEVEKQREELAHAGRLVSAGHLTASITHEINQSLTAILSNAEAGSMLLSQENPPLNEIKQIFDDIGADDLRAAEVIRRLRALLTKHAIERRSVFPNQIISETLKLLEPMTKALQITVYCRLIDPAPVLEGDSIQLQQVLLNLLMNAVEATKEAPVERRYIRIHTDVDSESNYSVSVSDSGPGISPEQMSNLFKPFFSTKPNGMGLGLFLVRSIVEAHGGTVGATSDGIGATFHITIPFKKDRSADAVLDRISESPSANLGAAS